MKVPVCGKRGRGESTIIGLLANEARATGWHLLVAGTYESNLGFFRMLGFDQPPTPLMELVEGSKGVFDEESLGAVFPVVTLCFIDLLLDVLKEAYRILVQSGKILLGLVLKESLWRKLYEERN